MAGKTLIITPSPERATEIIKHHTKKSQQEKNTQRIIEDYKDSYQILEETFYVGERKLHVDYLPTYDLFEQTKKISDEAREIAGAALYKVELEHTLFLTDPTNKRMGENYSKHEKDANSLADKLWDSVNEKYPNQWTHTSAMILGGSFELAFKETLYTWRMSLESNL